MHEETTSSSQYVGRFAPTPSGPLHFGSLIAAVGSYLDAHAHQGLWKLRIDDVDKPREVPGSADEILRALEGFGFEWDGPVFYQSNRLEVYEAALEQLQKQAQLYACACSRKEISEQAEHGSYGPIYPGTCRNGLKPGQIPRALRCITSAEPVCLEDRLQGHYCQYLQSEIGDFVVRRADNIIAYQLATVVDDHAQGITDIVRGVDLLDSTPRQIHLQQLLGIPTPRYLHLPIAVNQHHEKLSKQTHAPAIDPRHNIEQLDKVMCFLNHTPPEQLRGCTISEFWDWAKAHWDESRLPRQQQIVVNDE
jgi:glutamyl-Q tRNA(Asp) synthetase